MWDWKEIRALAIDKLSSCTTSIDRIVLGRRFEHPMWLTPAFADLCGRYYSLSPEEACQLEDEDITRIVQLRKEVICATRAASSTVTRYNLENTVRERFNLPSFWDIIAASAQTEVTIFMKILK